MVRVCIDWKADEFWILRAFDLLSDEVSFLKVHVRFWFTKILLPVHLSDGFVGVKMRINDWQRTPGVKSPIGNTLEVKSTR